MSTYCLFCKHFSFSASLSWIQSSPPSPPESDPWPVSGCGSWNSNTLVNSQYREEYWIQRSNMNTTIIWASWRENLSSGFLTKWVSNKSPQLQRLARNSKWIWSGNTTITNCRQPRGTARKNRPTITRHQEDKLSKAISSLFPIKMIAILEWT